MLDRLKKAMQRADRAEPMPSRQSTVMVPVTQMAAAPEREEKTMGYLDRRAPDSARPVIGLAPHLRTADQEVRAAWQPVAGHARHLLTTSGFLQYGVEISCAWTSGGDGLIPNVTPNADELGWEPSFAKTWARYVERRFKEWSHDPKSCDAQGRLKFGAMQSAALKGWFATGDIIGVRDYGEKAGTTWKTAISLIDPARLWTPAYQQLGTYTTDGIELTAAGRPVAYHFKPLSGFGQTIRIPASNNSGSMNVLHAYDGEPGTVRGISPLGAAIEGILQSQNVADAAIQAAHIAAMVVGVVTSQLPSDVLVSRMMGATGQDNPLEVLNNSRATWHEALKKGNAHLQLGHNAILAHLHPGEKLEMLAGKQTFSDYEVILRMGLAEAARAIGLAPEFLHGIKDEATYSSLKVAAVEARAIVERRRKILLEPLCEFALHQVIEEMIAEGELPFKVRRGGKVETGIDAFRKYRNFALKVEWVGPAIADPDPLKEVRAAVMRVQYGLSSLSDEIAAMGGDADTVFDKRADDRQSLRDHGLYLPWPDTGPKPTPKPAKGASSA